MFRSNFMRMLSSLRKMTTNFQTDLPFDVFEEELLDPIKGVDLSEEETFVAGLLLKATTDRPIRMAEVATAALHQKTLELSDRQIRTIVRSLRRTHGFPICSRKGKPA